MAMITLVQLFAFIRRYFPQTVCGFKRQGSFMRGPKEDCQEKRLISEGILKNQTLEQLDLPVESKKGLAFDRLLLPT